MSLQPFINQLKRSEHLIFEEMVQAAHCIFNEQTAKQDIADFLIAMSNKGETTHEVAGLASVMQSHAVKMDAPEGIYMDNCGTGGDGLHSFNISTTAAFVLAGGGILVAKHGNRKVSSSSGSSDVLEALGIELIPDTAQTTDLLKQY
ncbi:MAG: anthranilate phosphoribosyltransferase, partial [Solibacillus sp.]